MVVKARCKLGLFLWESNRTPTRNLAGYRLIRDRKETMQFLARGRYVAVVADGKVHLFRKK
jgi:hypothetical protein